MEALIPLIAKLGIDLALITLKNIQNVTTIEQAIAALENVKTTQQYIDEDAAARGVPAVPLPLPVPAVPSVAPTPP